jgi:hypothetical protein
MGHPTERTDHASVGGPSEQFGVQEMREPFPVPVGRPGPTLSVPGAGHLLMVQYPVGLAKGLSDFFATQRSSGPSMAATVAGVSAAGGRSGTS